MRIDRVLALLLRQVLFGWLTGGRPATISDDVAAACMMNGEMSTDRMLIRKNHLVVR